MRKFGFILLGLCIWSGGSIYLWVSYISPPKVQAYEVQVVKEFDADKAIASKSPELDPQIRALIVESINKHSRDKGLDPALVSAIIAKESNFNPMLSNKNRDGTIDRGLMQINDHYQRDRIKQHKVSITDLYHIDTNIKLGCEFLREKIDQYKNIKTAVQAYNSRLGQGYADPVLACYGQMQYEAR